MSQNDTKTYFLVRHAQSANNALPESQRVPDPGLTLKGELQAKHLAIFLSSLKIDRIYCSAFLRAIETAAPISQAIKLPAHVHNQIYEVRACYGGYIPTELVPEPGMGRSQILRRYADWQVDPSIDELGWNYNRPVETDVQADQRADTVAAWMSQHAFGTQLSESAITVLIIHADFEVKLLSSLQRLYGKSRNRLNEPWMNESPKNTSTTKAIFSRSGTVDITDYNSVAHLPADLITR